MVDGYNIGARNQHADSGAYEFHIHRAYNYNLWVQMYDKTAAIKLAAIWLRDVVLVLMTSEVNASVSCIELDSVTVSRPTLHSELKE